MKLIVGLGNPGSEYSGTRHNIGFLVVEELARRNKLVFKRDRLARALCVKGRIEGQEVMLALPQTYMNNSGVAVRYLLKKCSAGFQDLLVVCDDIDLEFARIKVRQEGASGGQRGLDSIISCLATRNFPRLRVGIGRPSRGGEQEVTDYVLSPFGQSQKKKLLEAVEKASLACGVWLKDGIEKSMNIFNRRQTGENSDSAHGKAKGAIDG